MGSQFWWFFDALVIACVLFVIFTNAKQGFRKNFIMMIGYAVCALIASGTSILLAEPIYQYSVRESNVEAFTSAIKEYDATEEIIACVGEASHTQDLEAVKINSYLTPAYSTFDQDIYNYVNKRCGYVVSTPSEFRSLLRENFIEVFGGKMSKHLPSYASEAMENTIREEPDVYLEVMQAMYGENTVEQAAEYLEDVLVKNTCLNITAMFLFLGTFLVLMSFVAMFSKKMEDQIYFNIHTSVDHIAGAFMGLVEAFVMLAFVAIFLKLIFTATTTDLMVLNEETIEKTRLFRYFFSIDKFL